MNIADVISPPEPPELAILDTAGVILAVNAAWLRFARENGAAEGWSGVGDSYLNVCDSAGDQTSLAVARAIRAAARGDLAGWAAIEVPCHSPRERRWFDVVISPRYDETARPVGAVVSIVRTGHTQPAPEPPEAPAGSSQLRLTLDDHPDALVAVDTDGRVVAANRAVCRMFGRPADGIVGHPVETLVPPGSRSMHRRLRAGFTHAPQRRPMGPAAQVLSGQHSDGSMIPIRVTLGPAVLDGREVVLAAIRDATALVAAESQARLVADLLDVTTDAIAVHTANDLRPVWVNRTLAELSGRSRDDLLHDAVGAGEVLDVEALRASAGPLLAGEAETVDLRGLLPRADGSALPVQIRVVYRERSPGEGYLIVVRRDLTDQERAEAERERLARLEERARISRDLHDGVIQALYASGMRLTAALENVTDPQTRERITAATGAIDTAMDLLRRTISRLSEPRNQVPVRDLLEAVIAMRTPALRHEPVLRITGDPESLPDDVVEELVHVITEAVSNVARHSHAWTSEVRLLVSTDESWEVLIHDDGCGFDPAATPRGNGLSNLAARAALMKATLVIRSSPGTGTDILVRSGVPDVVAE